MHYCFPKNTTYSCAHLNVSYSKMSLKKQKNVLKKETKKDN